MPGTPTTVTSCTLRSARQCSNASTKQAPFPLPTDERERLARRERNERTRLDRGPTRDRLGLALRVDRFVCLEDDLAFRRPERHLTHQHPIHRRRRLQPGRGVHHIARHHPLTRLRIRADRDQRLARVDPDPHMQIAAEIADRVPDRETRPHRPLRIVLVRDRRTEHRHHRVADELLHRAAEALQHPAQARVERRQRAPHVLHVELLAPAREPHQIREQHRDDLALLDPFRPGQASRTLPAELRCLRIVSPPRPPPHPNILEHPSAGRGGWTLDKKNPAA